MINSPKRSENRKEHEHVGASPKITSQVIDSREPSALRRTDIEEKSVASFTPLLLDSEDEITNMAMEAILRRQRGRERQRAIQAGSVTMGNNYLKKDNQNSMLHLVGSDEAPSRTKVPIESREASAGTETPGQAEKPRPLETPLKEPEPMRDQAKLPRRSHRKQIPLSSTGKLQCLYLVLQL